ncbi:hypothetical protein O9K51_06273 [Purpureocillium lavendulum]|uniref:Uncharacterized protein n=1 Tax=Purpureocillium lavendulum TaxID=1247861 RepID=A0AB34FMV6_9HYPO|nr:hypothetical protein O9K51_06273 [Purpureocillium lavendulum]
MPAAQGNDLDRDSIRPVVAYHGPAKTWIDEEQNSAARHTSVARPSCRKHFGWISRRIYYQLQQCQTFVEDLSRLCSEYILPKRWTRLC